MAWGRVKTEHAGPKRGKGYWGRKAAAKRASNCGRRREDRKTAGAAASEKEETWL